MRQSRRVPHRRGVFHLGRLVATPGALAAMVASGDSLFDFFNRHGKGDQGDLDEHDKAKNGYAIGLDLRILSAYHLTSGVKIWVITEADRNSITVLPPEEY